MKALWCGVWVEIVRYVPPMWAMIRFLESGHGFGKGEQVCLSDVNLIIRHPVVKRKPVIKPVLPNRRQR